MRGNSLLAVGLTIGALYGAVGVAQADNVQNMGTYAGDVIDQLQDWGYDVMLNGLNTDVRYMDQYERRYCTVLGTHPVVSQPLAPGEFQTVYVDLSCDRNPSTDISLSGN
jgi:hypothetical protein